MSEQDGYITGVLLDECLELNLHELCQLCRVTTDEITDMVVEGILEPDGNDPTNWRFRGQALTKVIRIIHLQRDLQVNLAGAALASDLLDELELLRCHWD